MLRFLLFLLLALPHPAWSWNAAGHRLIAGIAWQAMTPASQQKIAVLLARHPDYPRWIAKADNKLAETAFIEASTWPDDIRNDPRFFDDGEEPTPRLPGFVDMARNKRWHYLDLPLSGGANTGDGELQRQLPRQLSLLGCASSPAVRVQALPWVIHLVGDAHQPLHVASQADEGGNKFEIEDPFNPRLPFSNLHRWWDDRPGPPWLRGERLTRQIARLLRDHAPPKAGGIDVWLEESRVLANDAYPKTVGSVLPIITEDFRNNANRITGERLVAAGKRLAAVLDNVFGASHESGACPPVE